ncbi:MAG: M28 family peptidase [Eubacteriales bacterium]
MAERFSTDKLNAIVKELGSFARLVGSDGEAKGINYCKRIFKEIDLELKEDEFECVKGWVGHISQGIFALASSLIASMVILLITAPLANIGVIAAVLVFILILIPGIAGSKGYMKVGKKYTTKNLYASILPKKGVPKRYILLTGHHDTKSHTMSTIQRSAAYLLSVTGVVLLLLLVLTDLVLDFIRADVPQIITTLGIVFGAIGLCGTIPLSLNILGNKSPGAIDNASSVAVIYEISRLIKELGGLENTEVVVAIFGAEELGMWGSKAFLRKHLQEYPVDKTININIDMVGFKGAPVEIMEYAGLPKKKAISPFLSGLAFNTAKELEIELKGFWMPIGGGTDGFVIRDLGYDGCEFVVMEAAKQTHHSQDNYNKWDGNIGVKNCEIIYGIMDKLDAFGIEKLKLSQKGNY